MDYKLFIDGGGTSTKVYLTDLQHQIIAKSVFEGMNIQQGPLKILKNLTMIRDSIDKEICEVYLGMPGVHEFQDKPGILQIFAKSQVVEIITDIEVQEKLYIQDESYYMLCLGSGTIMIEKDQEHKKFLNGFGGIFQDQGSAFKFAQNFIAEAIIDWQNDLKTRFVDYVYEFFDIDDMEKVKLIYQNWNDIKPQLLSFSRNLLTQRFQDYEPEILKILQVNATEFFTYLQKVKLKPSIKKIYIFGGLFNSEYYKTLFSTEFKKLNLTPIFN